MCSCSRRKILVVEAQNIPPGCLFNNETNYYNYNTSMNPYEPLGGRFSKGICKQ
jgi:hypothetical protein